MRSPQSISTTLPGGDIADEDVFVVDAAVGALGAQDADFDLDQVEPTGMLGRVVELQAAQDAARLGGREAVVE